MKTKSWEARNSECGFRRQPRNTRNDTKVSTEGRARVSSPRRPRDPHNRRWTPINADD